MSDQFEKYIGNIFKQLNEHGGDAAEDQKLKETWDLYSNLKE